MRVPMIGRLMAAWSSGMTARQKIRQFLCAVCAVIACWLISGAIEPTYMRATTWIAPAWNNVSAIRVDSNTTAVTIDRVIGSLWGDGAVINEADQVGPGFVMAVEVTLRQVGAIENVGPMLDDGRSVSSCTGGRPRISILSGAPYRKTIGNTDAIRKLGWFMESPPRQGCTLVPGAYVADFQWSRKWLGMTFYTPVVSSNIFTMFRPLDMANDP